MSNAKKRKLRVILYPEMNEGQFCEYKTESGVASAIGEKGHHFLFIGGDASEKH